VGLAALLGVAIVVGFTVHPASHALDIEWNVECNVNHFATDDPIVYPGQPGASHMHSFYGNSSTNAFSTTDSLKAHDPTGACLEADKDNSAYWVPSIYHTNPDGTPALYTRNDKSIGTQLFKAYYRRAGGANGPLVHSIPMGLRMVAGDSHATTPQDVNRVYWDCGDTEHLAEPHNCGSGPTTEMRAGIRFPSCWDGVHLDSADHKSHMAYADESTGACPADHPVSLPAIEYSVIYHDLPWDSTYYLSSGGIYSEHGDFWNAWDSQVQNALVTTCLNQLNDCDGVEYNPQTNMLTNIANPINVADFTPDPAPSVSPVPTSSPGVKTGDVNGDGAVNVFDLSILLSAWNGNNAAADINKDGTVNVFDLSILLSHWGM
jgi:hypothetical protein